MDGEQKAAGCGLAMLAVIGTAFAAAGIRGWSDDRECVRRGLKQYNPTTGVLEWTKKAEAE